ncbi:hypothetical protein GUB10_15215 [Salegentibacter sp. BLCTC]|uniref:AbiTii domain-containing protein n=1 Tax=Salegentibacter sp. BLCTC TaxID=2697368 RepID=UPI00187B83B1|nr:hypothetical protein [Salegentibacter sp. BLCTC]MBE7641684.1 hypothetical protein [Salegentibacter sp. BLCTC]
MSDNNTFVLNNVINDLLDADKSLINPLMKLNYFGRLTKNIELTNYTENEINGYPADSEIPEYRLLGSRLFVDLQAGFHSHPNNEIPLSVLDEDLQNFFKNIPVFDSIREIEQMNSNMKDNKSPEVQLPVPLELLPRIQPPAVRLYKSTARLQISGARLIGSGLKILRITEKVRTNLLAFSMELADKFGYEIKIEEFNEKQATNNQTIIKYMTTNNIKNAGDGNVINTGDKAKITANIQINKGNKNELADFLQEKGVSKDDTKELLEIVDKEEPDQENKKFGEKVNEWIKKMIGKALEGTWNVGVGAAGSILAEGIGAFYGF